MPASALALRPVLGRTAATCEISRRVDQSDVRKRLWKIADEAARHRIVSFRQKTDVVTNIQQALEYFPRFLMPML